MVWNFSRKIFAGLFLQKVGGSVYQLDIKGKLTLYCSSIVTGKVYYCNGREIGIVTGGVSTAWSKASVVFNIKDTTKVISGPPVGSLLEYFNGRMYVVQQNVVWVSEQYDVNAFDLAKGLIQFESGITMVQGVTDGLWVGTRNRVVFLRGSHPGDFKYEVKGMFGIVS